MLAICEAKLEKVRSSQFAVRRKKSAVGSQKLKIENRNLAEFRERMINNFDLMRLALLLKTRNLKPETTVI
jgi:hypothetical protein